MMATRVTANCSRAEPTPCSREPNGGECQHNSRHDVHPSPAGDVEGVLRSRPETSRSLAASADTPTTNVSNLLVNRRAAAADATGPTTSGGSTRRECTVMAFANRCGLNRAVSRYGPRDGLDGVAHVLGFPADQERLHDLHNRTG